MRRAWLLIAITATGCGGATQAKPGSPLSFAPNRGQFSRSVRFAAQGAGYELAAKDGGLELALADQRVHVAIPGRPRAGAPLPGTANYFFGDRSQTDVPTYAGVAYDDAWPGAVRVPLRLNAAARKLRRKRALSAKLTLTFQPADGPVLTSSATVKLKRAAVKRRARTQAAARRSAVRSR